MEIEIHLLVTFKYSWLINVNCQNISNTDSKAFRGLLQAQATHVWNNAGTESSRGLRNPKLLSLFFYYMNYGLNTEAKKFLFENLIY